MKVFFSYKNSDLKLKQLIIDLSKKKENGSLNQWISGGSQQESREKLRAEETLLLFTITLLLFILSATQLFMGSVGYRNKTKTLKYKM